VGGSIAIDGVADVDATVTHATRIAVQNDGNDGATRSIVALDIEADSTFVIEEGSSVRVTGNEIALEDALTVPVRALLALSEGGWAVEVPDAGGTKLVGVELIDVADTTAVIAGLDEGDEVVVPL